MNPNIGNSKIKLLVGKRQVFQVARAIITLLSRSKSSWVFNKAWAVAGLRALAAVAALVPATGIAWAQADFEKGFQAYQSYHGTDFDTVNLANGNLVLNIPLLSYEQRGGVPPVVISIRSNGTTFQSAPPFQNGPSDTKQHEVASGVIGAPWGQPHVVISPGGLYWKEERITVQKAQLSRFVATDESGATHSLGGGIANSTAGLVPGIMYSVDGSGLMLQPASGSKAPVLVDRKGNVGGLIDPNGNAITLQGPCAKPAGGGDFFNPSLATWEGNAYGTASATSIVDTVGRVIPNPSYLPPTAAYSCLVDLDASYHPAAPDVNGCETKEFPGQAGGTVPLVFCYADIVVSAGIPTPGQGESSPGIETINESWWVLTSVTLPNQTQWKFTYDNYGQVNSVTMPTGATVSYSYNNGNNNNLNATRLACGNPPGQIPVTGTPVWPFSNLMSSRMVTSRTLNLNDGSPAQVWNYASTIGSGWASSPNSGTVTVTDPYSNATVHTFLLIGGAVCGPFETATQYYQGPPTGTLLKTVATLYSFSGTDFANPTNFSNYTAVGVFPSQVTTTLGTGTNAVVSQDVYTYDSSPPNSFGTYQDYLGKTHPFSFGEMLSLTESDWGTQGSGNPGSVLRTTLHTKLWQSNWSYYAANLIDLPCLDTVFSGNYTGSRPSCTAPAPPAAQVSQTTYAYDQNSCLSGARGNLTAVTRWLNGGTSPTSKTVYNCNGMPTQKIDPNNNTTTIGYDGTGLYANQIQYPLTGTTSHIEYPAYDANTGELLSNKDENGNTTTFTYDNMRRHIEVVPPTSGGTVSYCYTDEGYAGQGGTQCSITGPPYEVVVTEQITASMNKVTTDVVDGLGRLTQTQLNSDPSGTTYSVVTYDAIGRKASQYNPTRCNPPTTTCGELTWGVTSYSYDALNRILSVTEPDTSIVSTSYSGNSSTVIDEVGNSRQSFVDSLGRLTEVMEDPNVKKYETDYVYDALGNLLSVNQRGGSTNQSNWRPRTFVYDSLSRLSSATNPESGKIAYSYVNSGGGLCAGDISALCTKTAPSPNQISTGTKTVATTFTYDALNRLTGKSYNDSYANPATPSVAYGYDGVALTGCRQSPPGDPDTYPVGRRTAMCDGSGATSWTHDSLGRVLQERRDIGAVTSGKYLSNVYNLDGSAATVTSLGYSVAYTYSAAGRPLTATSFSPTTKFASAATYAPPGELTGMTMGSSTTFAGFTTTNAYNDRLQPILLSAASPTATVFSLCFDFHLHAAVNTAPCSFSASTLGDNGNVYQVVNNLTSTRTRQYTYDSLNRIATGQSTGTQWGESYTIDPWGNMTAIGSYNSKPHESLSTSATTNNQLAAFVYDAAGNLIQNGTTTYTYDAENRLISTNANGSYSYFYDGEGKRVEKCTPAGTTAGTCASGATGTLYWKAIGGSHTLTETDLTGTVQNNYIFFDGKRVARRDSSTVAHYYFSDHLGTHALIENATGTACEQDADYYPYGGQQSDYCTTPVPQNYKFTGKERDAESGLDMFGARYYGSSMGRFITPDWAAKATAVPDANFGIPQSLNLYGYAHNNPLSKLDNDGHAVILMIWATHDGKVGHSAVAVSNYRQASVRENGRTVTRMVPDGTYTYKDLWPGGGGANRSNFNQNIPGIYQTKTATESNLVRTDVSGSEGRAPDGVIKINSGYAADQATLSTLSGYAASHPDYNGVSNNCSTFAVQGVDAASGTTVNAEEHIKKYVPFYVDVDVNADTPNHLWKAASALPNTTVLKDPGNLVDNSFASGAK
jgi:RHS repeat-associated protein